MRARKYAAARRPLLLHDLGKVPLDSEPSGQADHAFLADHHRFRSSAI
jgi:hypothetical protein